MKRVNTEYSKTRKHGPVGQAERKDYRYLSPYKSFVSKKGGGKNREIIGFVPVYTGRGMPVDNYVMRPASWMYTGTGV